MRLFFTKIDVYEREDHALREVLEGKELPVTEEEYHEEPCCIDLDSVDIAYRVPGDARRKEYTKIETRGGARTCINMDYILFVKEWGTYELQH
jgi:hypothetical protein